MKKKIIVFTGLLLFLSGSFMGCTRDKNQNDPQEPSLSISYAPDLSGLATDWAAVYGTLHPDLPVKVISEAVTATDLQAAGGSLLLVSDQSGASAIEQSHWKEVIGREIIVPVIHAENPFMEEIRRRGVSPGMLAKVFGSKEGISWGEILGTGMEGPVEPFIVEDASVLSGMAAFLELEPSEIRGIRMTGGEALVAAVLNDPMALGICKVADLEALQSKDAAKAVLLLPIDGNGNGRIDFKEDIYADLALFTRGVWIGKYPRELVNNIYSVLSLQPVGETESAFLKWVLTDGQALLDNNGFTRLEQSESNAKVILAGQFDVARPAPAPYPVPDEPLHTRIFFLALMIVLALILIVTVSGILVRDRSEEQAGELIIPETAFSETSIDTPQGLYYDRTHTWLFMDPTGMVRIGIDDFLQRVTGTLTNIKMMKTGERIRKGKKVLSIIQEGKQLDIYSPISGTIAEINDSLSGNASLLNSSPYAEGWIYKIKPSNWLQDIKSYLMVRSYKEWLRTEIQRLKDFVAEYLRPETVAVGQVLQDGGELREHILQGMGPEIWEEFQSNFMDVPS